MVETVDDISEPFFVAPKKGIGFLLDRQETAPPESP